jgi:uridine kinase
VNIPDLNPVVRNIIDVRRRVAGDRAALIAVSGIDASGKGFLTGKLAEQLQSAGFRVANINIDGWLNLPHVRFNPSNPAEHFYLNAIRFDEMFEQLVLPLRSFRGIDMEMDFAAETAANYRKQRVTFEDIDIVLLEGIYLLKREYQACYNDAIWIDCTFETALERAIARAQEGLAPVETIRAYQTIYFPAQEIHFTRDNPKAAATTIIGNDPRLLAA